MLTDRAAAVTFSANNVAAWDILAIGTNELPIARPPAGTAKPMHLKFGAQGPTKIHGNLKKHGFF